VRLYYYSKGYDHLICFNKRIINLILVKMTYVLGIKVIKSYRNNQQDATV